MPRLVGVTALLVVLAGCAGPTPREVAVAYDSASSSDLPGVTVSAYHNVTGDLHTIDLVARNLGPWTYFVYTSQSGAFSDTMRGPQGEVTIRNNTYTMECGWTAFAPDDILRDEVTWDETIYQGQDNEGRDNPTKPAPPGTYVWTVRLTAWHENTCPYEEDKDAIDLTFDVEI